MQFPMPICLNCKHLLEDDPELFHCEAFPERIPYEIYSSEHDHHKPFPGDHGITFTPRNGPPVERE